MKQIAIKENHLYNKTFRRGKSFVGKYTAIYVLRDLSAERLKKENPRKKYVNRVGLSVSKKIGGAVERNRAKRIIRAAFDVYEDRLSKGNLIVISARTSIVGKKSQDIAREFAFAFEKLSLLRQENKNEEKQK